MHQVNSSSCQRLFINWLFDLVSPDPILDGANFQVLIAFTNAFHALQLLKILVFRKLIQKVGKFNCTLSNTSIFVMEYLKLKQLKATSSGN
ncbi:unnamed protein product, partial [Vitis vinifera]|uniref:Uncharacterized protein n=1 Tax=Vitis vinifera TaxID=29760 RepID=D7TLC6_VITVI